MTILIRGAQVIDGTGKPSFKSDVWIKGDKIGALGSFPDKKADEVIEARGTGTYLAPGFIDINTDSDHYLSLFTNPDQKDFLLQGVTTIIGGNCGASLAPLVKGKLDSVRKWANLYAINVNWRSVGEFLEVLSKVGLGVNFGTLVGHSTVRRDIIGEIGRDLTPKELDSFKSVLKSALKEGAFGLSTGLGYSHSKKVPYFEVAALAGVVKEAERLYATHLRNETEDLLASVKETLNIAKETGVKTEVSHLRPLIGWEEKFEEALNLIEENANAADVNFDIYPFDISAVSIYTLLPDWVSYGGFKTILKNIETPALSARIRESLPDVDGNSIVIAQAPGHEFLIGKTLAQFCENRGFQLKDGLIRLMKLTGLRAIIFYRNINSEAMLKTLVRDSAIVSSNGASLPEGRFLNHERSTNTFPKFLELASKGLMPIEKAVYKITGLPARKCGLRNRGTVGEGKYADLTMFQDGKIITVIVNGRIAVGDGAWRGTRNGRPLTAS